MKRLTRIELMVCGLLVALLCGCSVVPSNSLLISHGELAAMSKVMARKDEIVLVSSTNMDSKKPVLLLIHGATEDPTEMMKIVEEASTNYNVLLYCYNYHLPIKKVAADLATELKTLAAQNRPLRSKTGALRDLTVVTFSYSAAIFHETVLLANDPELFANASLIQLVPTSGGSYLARKMGNSDIIAWLISQVSQPSAAENPHGRIAEELWGDEGTRTFYRSIKPARMHTILIEGDRHSVNRLKDPEIRKRYQNGIGTNVIVIPKLAGVTHEELPNQPFALTYLGVLLKLNPSAPALAHNANLPGALPVSVIP